MSNNEMFRASNKDWWPDGRISVAQTIVRLQNCRQPLDDRAIDRLFGIDFDNTEGAIPIGKYGSDIWRNGPIVNTQTSYEIIRVIFAQLALSNDTVFYDLGSGHGRVLLYGACLFPNVCFRGIEVVAERALQTRQIARNIKLANVGIFIDDVLNVDYTDGSVFYLFNPFPKIMNRVLDCLFQIATMRRLTLVTTGRTTEDVRLMPWLKPIRSFGYRSLSIYQSVCLRS